MKYTKEERKKIEKEAKMQEKIRLKINKETKKLEKQAGKELIRTTDAMPKI